MKILSIKYKNNEQEWEYEEINFFDLTLLVGVSGVGKTQILDSIFALKKISQGFSVNGVEWEINFSTFKNDIVKWTGEFEKIQEKIESAHFIFDDPDEIKPKIIFEELLINNKLVVERDFEKFYFESKEMPKLVSTESAIHILKEEELIKEVYENFKLIILRDHTQKIGFRYTGVNIEQKNKNLKNIEDIKGSDLDTFQKIVLTYSIAKSTFDEIKNKFIDVFPQIEDVRVEQIELGNPDSTFKATTLQIKEKNVQKWIPHNRVSSGMLRTLLHIAEMHLWNEGTVILIDEFENSLGLNCIDILTDDLIYNTSNVQFIATSHHPYIINKIPYEYWKIVTRIGSIIKIYDAKDFDLGKSHHDRFMSLINHPFYKQGIS